MPGPGDKTHPGKDQGRGKVVQFKPRQGKEPRLKSVDYVDPAKKEMLRQREKHKKTAGQQRSTITSVAVFILIIAFFYLISELAGR